MNKLIILAATLIVNPIAYADVSSDPLGDDMRMIEMQLMDKPESRLEKALIRFRQNMDAKNSLSDIQEITCIDGLAILTLPDYKGPLSGENPGGMTCDEYTLWYNGAMATHAEGIK